MKTKKLFLLAAMLLMSVCSFAQNDNTPLKGDVNEDGKVDVADIAAVINIMKNGGGTTDGKLYFSVGTTAPTASNYTTANNATTTIPTTETYWNNSGAKASIYILVPSNKTITIVDASIQSPIAFTEDTSVTITNHKVYKTTARIANGGGIKITITDAPMYYYYIGWTLPTASNVDTIITETYPTSSSDATQHAAGKKTTSKSSFSLASINLYYSVAKTNYYLLVPTGHAIYDTVFGQQLGSDSFTSEGTITVGNQIHTIYKSVETSRNIASIEIK